ncbi:MAG: hypothetical protein R2748_28225 [Bryobacterales bacterium]
MGTGPVRRDGGVEGRGQRSAEGIRGWMVTGVGPVTSPAVQAIEARPNSSVRVLVEQVTALELTVTKSTKLG